jgi:hypothetical protein
MTYYLQADVGWNELAIAWGLTLSLTLTVAAVMRRPLYAILQFICGTDTGARFWTAYSSVILVVGPLFLVSLGSFGSANLADFVRRTTMLISLGQIITVAIMGIAVRLCGKQPFAPIQPNRASASPVPAPAGQLQTAPAE